MHDKLSAMPKLPPLIKHKSAQPGTGDGLRPMASLVCMIGTAAREHGSGTRSMRADLADRVGLGPNKEIEPPVGESQRPVSAYKTDLRLDMGPRYARSFHEGWRMVVDGRGLTRWYPVANPLMGR